MRWTWVIMLWLAGSGFAAEPVTRYYPLGIADPEDVMERARLVTSPEAKVWLNLTPQQNQLCVTDTAERLASIGPLIRSLQQPPRNITLRVRYPDFVTLPNSALSAGLSSGSRTGLTGMPSSPFGPGKIRFTGPPPPVVNPGEPRGTPATPPAANETSVVVPSGKGAWLMVSPAPPNATWIFQWGAGRNLWPATPRWTQVKANVYVVPKLRGDSIRLRIMPGVSFAAGVAQRNLALESMMLEKNVASGDEIEVNAASFGDEEFHRQFFMTPDRNRRPVPMQLWITPTAP